MHHQSSSCYGDVTKCSTAKAMLVAKPIVSKITEGIRLSMKENGVFTVCDYGTCDGIATFPLMNDIISTISKTAVKGLKFTVIYEDQESNDYNTLVKNTQALWSSNFNMKNISLLYCATSFYEQCLPSNSLDVGLCFIACHWLSKCPCTIQKGLFSFSTEVTQEERLLFQKQSAQDWETFLLCRAKEMKSGSHLVTGCLSTLDDGTTPSAQNLHELMSEVWTQLWRNGRVKEEEFVNATFPVYYPSAAELSAPFNDPASPVTLSGLRLNTIQTEITPWSIHTTITETSQDSIERGQQSEDVFSEKLVQITKSWSYNIIWRCLSDSRSDQEKSDVLEEYYNILTGTVRDNPEDYNHDLVMAYLDIEKE